VTDAEPPKRKRGRPRKRLLIPGELRAALKAEAGKPKPPPPQVPKPPPPPPPAARLDGFQQPDRDEKNDSERVKKIFKFIRNECRVPEGRLMGRPMRLETWQKEAIRAIYGNPHGTRRAIISMARKNGKTSFVAALLLVHLIGPEANGQENSQLYSAAQSRDQAALIFNAACKIINQNVDMRAVIKITESSKLLTNIELNIRYRALAADATTAFGLSPALCIHDELGQVRGPRSPLYEALETATGAQESPLSIIISTQAPSDQDLLSILIDDAKAAHDPHTVLQFYTAPVELDPFIEATIRIANPAFDTILNTKEVLAMAHDAKRMPAREGEYRNLCLNQRVEAEDPFISPSVWAACGDPVGSFEGCDVYGGLDLSSVADLTALVLIARKGDMKWHVRPTFWLPSEGLVEKAAADRTPYDLWARQGHLMTTPGRTVSYDYVAVYLRKIFSDNKIARIAFDRWAFEPNLKPALTRAGMSAQFIEQHFVPFGQGYQSMSPALRDLEQVLLDGKLVHGGHPVLTNNVMNAVVVTDEAKNRKLSKKRATGRIDGLVALTMAIGIAPLKTPIIDVEALIV
jgi:phage terminase large subunit-like protein